MKNCYIVVEARRTGCPWCGEVREKLLSERATDRLPSSNTARIRKTKQVGVLEMGESMKAVWFRAYKGGPSALEVSL